VHIKDALNKKALRNNKLAKVNILDREEQSPKPPERVQEKAKINITSEQVINLAPES